MVVETTSRKKADFAGWHKPFLSKTLTTSFSQRADEQNEVLKSILATRMIILV